MDDGNYTNATLAFVKWLEANGTTVSDKIDLVDMRNQDAGRGVVAKENIAEDETLFTIPRKTILTTETSSIPKEISSSIADPWLSLIVTMLYEFQQASNSPWAAYFDVLPSDFDTLMFWDEAELKHLSGSAVVDKIGRASADETFQEQILPLVYANVATFNAQSLSNDQLLALCHRMGSTIMAYAFDLESSSAASNSSQDGWEEDSDDEGAGGPVMPKGMVPLADTLNANADLNNAKLFHEEDAVVMRSVKPIAAGEQIYNDYGLLPRADLLRRYGYVTEEYAKYDVVELGEDIITQTAKEHQRLSDDDLANRLAFLDEQAVLDSGYDIARPGSEDGALPEELSVLLNALTTPAADFEKMQKKDKLPKAELTPSSLELLYTILLRRRAEYGPEGTDALRAQLIDGQNNSRRRAMALQVVIGEREILAEVAADVQSKLASGSRKRGADALDFEGEAREVLAKKARN